VLFPIPSFSASFPDSSRILLRISRPSVLVSIGLGSAKSTLSDLCNRKRANSCVLFRMTVSHFQALPMLSQLSSCLVLCCLLAHHGHLQVIRASLECQVWLCRSGVPEKVSRTPPPSKLGMMGITRTNSLPSQAQILMAAPGYTRNLTEANDNA